MDAVLDLANCLRRDGVDCSIDQYTRSPAQGWPRWCEKQVEDSKFVLVVCTDTYLRRFQGKEERGRGKGVTFEGYIITQELYNAQGKNEKFIPIVFSAGDGEHIPVLLQGASSYDVSTREGYDEVYFGILGQPKVTPPDIGQTRSRSDIAGNPSATAASRTPLPKREAVRDFVTGPSSAPPSRRPYPAVVAKPKKESKVATRYFLDRQALAWIILLIPSSTVFILSYAARTSPLGRFHLVGYWILSALLFYEAWRITNLGEKSAFYVNHAWRRRIVAMLVFPTALVSSSVVFPVLMEGYRKPPGVLIFLLVVLGFITGANGFVATRERPVAECTTEDAKQAREIQKGSSWLFVGLITLFGGIAVFEAVRSAYATIWDDSGLLTGVILMAIALSGALLIYPWTLVRDMKSRIPTTTTPGTMGP